MTRDPRRCLGRVRLRGPATLCLLAVGCAPPDGSPAGSAEGGAGAPSPPHFPAQNRPDVRGTHGAVSSDHPLASAAGYDVLRRGGNAVDAAVAMAGVLAVVRPHMNGVGGDAFALFYDGRTGQVSALNGSGRAGALGTPGFFAERDMDSIPQTGPLSVSMPGAVAAWADALERFGTRTLAELLEPAIGYARDGFPVSTRLASDFEAQGADLNEPGRALYLPGGHAPPVGSLLRNPELARTLEAIAREGKAGFYGGAVAERLSEFIEAQGGMLRVPDFGVHASTWVEPLRGEYLEHTFLVMPPNTQGLAQIQMMEMAKAQSMNELGHNTSRYLHTMVELKKLAFADRDRWVADPEHAEVPVAELLDPGYLAGRAALVDPSMAAPSVTSGIGTPATAPGEVDDGGDTVYLTVVDANGNAVSWIQSLFSGFGSGLLEPVTGVVLQNRGALFTLDEGHPNLIAPGKRPYHTLTPTLALRDGRLAFTLGTPGGDSQIQSILQVVQQPPALRHDAPGSRRGAPLPEQRGYGPVHRGPDSRRGPGGTRGSRTRYPGDRGMDGHLRRGADDPHRPRERNPHGRRGPEEGGLCHRLVGRGCAGGRPDGADVRRGGRGSGLCRRGSRSLRCARSPGTPDARRRRHL
ncbi:MAG TPA: gamma-glutamyltransferase family protein [Longimicrobiales bacterium]